jgi:hypothetical protein
VRRASFNEKSSRGTGVTSEEKRKRLSRILPPWCQQPSKSPQSPIAEVQSTAAGSTNGKGGRIAADKARKNDDTALSKKAITDSKDTGS